MENSKNINLHSDNYYGLMTGLGLMAMFLAMKFLGLVEVLELRYLNFLIMVLGLILTVQYKIRVDQGKDNYLQLLGYGLRTGMIATVIFSFFLFFYLKIDTTFMQYLKDNAMFGSYLTPSLAAEAVAAEGIASVFVATFVIMQYFKVYAPNR